MLDVYQPPAVTPNTEDTPPQQEPEPVIPKVVDAAPKLELVKPKAAERKAVPQKEITDAPPVPTPAAKPVQQGSSICDVCGHKNVPDARDCESCDVPLPVAIEMEAKTVKRKPAFEIPERDDRLERLVSALWRPVLFLIVLITAFVLIRSHWSQLRGISGSLQNQHPISSAAASTAITRR